MIQNTGLALGVKIKHDIPCIPIAFILLGDNVTEDGRGLKQGIVWGMMLIRGLDFFLPTGR